MLVDEPKPVKTPTCGGCVLLLITFVVMAAIFFYLIPFGPSGNKASKAQLCATNLSLLATAFAQYAQDYDGSYPNGVIRNSSGAGWAGQLFPYAKTIGVYRCAGEIRSASLGNSVVSYGYNTNVARSHSISGLTSPPVTVLLFEVANSDANINADGRTAWDEGASNGDATFSPAGNGVDSMLISNRPDAPASALYATGPLGGRPELPERSQFAGSTPRHDSLGQYLFGDGHVAALPGGAVSSGANATRASASQTGGTFGNAAGVATTGKVGTFSID